MLEDPDAIAVSVLSRGLDRAQTAVLRRRYEADRSDAARDQLVAVYSRLVLFAGRRISLGLPAIACPGQVLLYGESGLAAAVESFDWSREERFDLYALRRIREAIIDRLRLLGGAPVSWRWHRERVAKHLQDRLGRPPSDEETRREWDAFAAEREAPSNFVPIPHTTLAALDELWSVSAADSDRVSLLEPFPEGHANRIQERRDGRDTCAFLIDALSNAPTALAPRTGGREWIAEAVAELDGKPGYAPSNDRLLAYLYFYENMLVLDIGGLVSLASGRIPARVGLAVLRLRAALATLPGSLWSFPEDPERMTLLP